MKQVGSLLALLAVLVVAYLIYARLTRQSGKTALTQQVDVVGIKEDLISIAQAERMYLAAHGTYATLDELRGEGSLLFPITNRRGYSYTASLVGGERFKVTASPADLSKDLPIFSIDETMQVFSQDERQAVP